MALDALWGNHALKSALPHPDRLPHALLLSGPPGSGRHTLSRLLSQMLLCEHPDKAPCGVCPSCQRVAEGIHPDAPPLSDFVAPKDREKKLISVDTVRALRADAFIRPNQGQRKVYVLEQAERMNPNAQNALLKVLEDGPEYVTFLLLTDNPAALLPTIRSRCVACPLTPLSRQEAAEALAERFPDREWKELSRAAEACHGILGDAISLLEGDSHGDPAASESVERCAAALSERSELALMEWAVRVQNDKLSREQLTQVYRLMRQSLLDALAGRGAGRGLSEALRPGQLSALARLCDTGAEAMERNVAPAISAGWFAVEAAETVLR